LSGFQISIPCVVYQSHSHQLKLSKLDYLKTIDAQKRVLLLWVHQHIQQLFIQNKKQKRINPLKEEIAIYLPIGTHI